jgi:hypothetical protein
VPDGWKKVCFSTSKESLADFLIELSKKLKFWREFLENETKTFWLPAFYDPKALLGALV